MSTDFHASNHTTPENLPQQKIVRPSGFSHSFDTGIASSLGLGAAVVFNHIVYWLKINAAKGKNKHEGRTWMYETAAQIAEYFDYLTERQVKYALNLLVEAGLIRIGNFNKNKFDRTLWYSLVDESILGVSKNDSHLTNLSNGLTNLSNGKDEIVNCIIQVENNKKKQVVVGGTPPPKEEMERKTTKDDVYHYSLTAKTDWQPEEIESAWEAFEKSKSPIAEPYKYIDGIIRKKRAVSSKTKEIECQKTYSRPKIKARYEPSKPTSPNSNGAYSNLDMSAPSLAKFGCL
jgi:hypothetical protein